MKIWMVKLLILLVSSQLIATMAMAALTSDAP
jgi:hypothetical protein